MNTAPKLPDQLLAWNVRNALGPYNDDDMPLIDLIIQLRNKLAALAPPSGEGVDAFRVMRSAFVTSESCGPEGDYRLVFRFRSLEALQQAHREWVTTPHSAPVDEVIRYEPLSPTSNTMMRVVDTVSPDWAKRGEHPTDWINELGTLGQHPNAMPHWVRTAIKTIYHGLTTTPPPASQERGGKPWRREWEGSGPQCGWHIVEAVRLYNNERVAYLGDNIDSRIVDAIINAHNATHRPTECANGCPPFQVCDFCQSSGDTNAPPSSAAEASINPPEIDSKLIPDAAEQAKPDGDDK